MKSYFKISILIVLSLIFISASKPRISTLKIVESGFIKRCTNSLLKEKIAYHFDDLVDAVLEIEAHSNTVLGDYYLILGEKNDKDIHFTLATTPQDFVEETYTYINFTSLYQTIALDVQEVEYCRKEIKTLENSDYLPITSIRIQGECWRE